MRGEETAWRNRTRQHETIIAHTVLSFVYNDSHTVINDTCNTWIRALITFVMTTEEGALVQGSGPRH